MSRCSLKSNGFLISIFFLSLSGRINSWGENIKKMEQNSLFQQRTNESGAVQCFHFDIVESIDFLFILNKCMRAHLVAPFKCHFPFKNSDKSMTLSDIVQLTETENRLHISTSFSVRGTHKQRESMKLNDHCYARTKYNKYFFNSERMQFDCYHYFEINANCCVYIVKCALFTLGVYTAQSFARAFRY